MNIPVINTPSLRSVFQNGFLKSSFLKSSVLSVAGLLLAGTQPLVVQAAGFQLMEQSVTGLGRSFAGGSLPGDDASAAFYNPADMIALGEGQHTQLGFTYVDLDMEVEGDYVSPLPGATASGKANGGTDSVIPNFHWVGSVNDQVSLGLAITAPFGLATEYSSNWIGRYEAIKSEIIVTDINPSIAYKINDHWHVGAGLSYQKAEAELVQAVHFASFNPVLSATDGVAKITGDDKNWGYNLGVTWLPHNDMKVSATYRSKVEHELDGKREVTGLTGPAVVINGVESGGADITLPETFTLNTWQRFNDKWEIMASWRYTRWSRFEELRVVYDNPAIPDTVEEERWKNSWSFSLGSNYKVSDKVTFRSGMSYDNTPVPDSEHRGPRIPDSDRIWFSVGASWQLTRGMSVDAGYTYLMGKSEDMNYTGQAGQLTAEVKDPSAHIVGVQFQYKF